MHQWCIICTIDNSDMDPFSDKLSSCRRATCECDRKLGIGLKNADYNEEFHSLKGKFDRAEVCNSRSVSPEPEAEPNIGGGGGGGGAGNYIFSVKKVAQFFY